MEDKTLNIMLVSREPEELSTLALAMNRLVPLKQTWAPGPDQALSLAAKEKFDLVIVGDGMEEGPFNLLRGLLAKDAFINTAVVSDEDPEFFHELSEGLGVLAQLSPAPGPQEAKLLVNKLKKIGLVS